MPTTTIVDSTMKVAAVQDRTDAAGTPVTDVDGEELRLFADMFGPGVLKAGDFEVTPGAGLSVDVGSGVAKEDVAVVPGTVAGQGNYLARLDVGTANIPLSAADLSNPRLDEIYIVVADDNYDSGGLTLPRLGYRKGDPAASPAAPGPDGSWDAYLLLATVTVGVGASSVSGGDITDERELAEFTAGVNIDAATTATAGIVQLSNSYVGSSQVKATTEKALSDGLATKADSHTHPYSASGHTHSYLPLSGGNMTGALLLDAGTEALPGLAFVADGNTGFYVTGNNGQLRWAGNGQWGGLLHGNGIQVNDGSPGAPSMSFHQDGDLGFYRSGAQIRWAAGGVFGGYLFQGGVALPDGTTPATASLVWANDSDTGLFRPVSNSVAIGAGGVEIARFVSGAISFPAAGTTTDNGLPGWRQLSSGDRSLNALVSSRRYKKDIADADPEEYVGMIRALRMRTFKSKLDNDDGRKKILGLIAEETHEVAPAYTDNPDEDGNVEGVYYEGFISPMLVTLQYLLDEVEALKN